MDLNTMMDPRPLYPEMYHPAMISYKLTWDGSAKRSRRVKHPVKYYLIDFGLSRKYDPEDPSPLELPIFGGDKTVPEFQQFDEPCNPFRTDIYYIGSLIRMCFFKASSF